jgi:uncharacterized membrane protein (UPF0127 family)
MPKLRSTADPSSCLTPPIAFLFLLTGLLTTGCGSDPVVTRQSLFRLEIGEVVLEAQLAIDPATRRKGLMHRESLAANQGMLFISERPETQSFWMRNTLIPLDIGFFTEDGILREIYPLYPRVETHTVSRRSDIKYALEMNRGWFKANGVKVGQELNLELVNEARRALVTAK